MSEAAHLGGTEQQSADPYFNERDGLERMLTSGSPMPLTDVQLALLLSHRSDVVRVSDFLLTTPAPDTPIPASKSAHAVAEIEQQPLGVNDQALPVHRSPASSTVAIVPSLNETSASASSSSAPVPLTEGQGQLVSVAATRGSCQFGIGTNKRGPMSKAEGLRARKAVSPPDTPALYFRRNSSFELFLQSSSRPTCRLSNGVRVEVDECKETIALGLKKVCRTQLPLYCIRFCSPPCAESFTIVLEGEAVQFTARLIPIRYYEVFSCVPHTRKCNDQSWALDGTAGTIENRSRRAKRPVKVLWDSINADGGVTVGDVLYYDVTPTARRAAQKRAASMFAVLSGQESSSARAQAQ